MSRAELAERLEQIGGCGNAHCIVYDPPGQHTNGGCKCNRDPMRMTQTVWAYKQALASSIAREDALQAEVERLKAALIAALGTYDTALSAATFTKPRTGQVILNVKTAERLNETLRAALKGAPHE